MFCVTGDQTCVAVQKNERAVLQRLPENWLQQCPHILRSKFRSKKIHYLVLVIPCFKLAWGISAINVWDSHFLITNVIRLFIRLGRRVHKIVLYSIIQSHSFHKMISFRHGVCAVLNSAQLPLTPFLTISFNNSEIWVRTSLPEIASARTPSVARLRSFWQAKSSKRVTS